jgi:hypothetical protein
MESAGRGGLLGTDDEKKKSVVKFTPKYLFGLTVSG